MIRGTTAQWKLKLPYTYDEISDIKIIFWQPGNPSSTLPIIKSKQNCRRLSAQEVLVSLRPSETAVFSDRYRAKMQLTITPAFGSPIGIEERLITVYPMPDNIIADDSSMDPDIPIGEEWVILNGDVIEN